MRENIKFKPGNYRVRIQKELRDHVDRKLDVVAQSVERTLNEIKQQIVTSLRSDINRGEAPPETKAGGSNSRFGQGYSCPLCGAIVAFAVIESSEEIIILEIDY